MKNAAAIKSNVSGPVSVFVASFGTVGFGGVTGVGVTVVGFGGVIVVGGGVVDDVAVTAGVAVGSSLYATHS